MGSEAVGRQIFIDDHGRTIRRATKGIICKGNIEVAIRVSGSLGVAREGEHREAGAGAGEGRAGGFGSG
jgi:hypothetical protein